MDKPEEAAEIEAGVLRIRTENVVMVKINGTRLIFHPDVAELLGAAMIEAARLVRLMPNTPPPGDEEPS